jgi:hypothetical protein
MKIDLHARFSDDVNGKLRMGRVFGNLLVRIIYKKTKKGGK